MSLAPGSGLKQALRCTSLCINEPTTEIGAARGSWRR